MPCPRWALLAVLLTIGRPAQSAGLAIEAAGGYWFEAAPQFQMTLKATQPLGEVVQVGLRAGVLFHVRPALQVGVPLDVVFRFRIKQLFLEPAGGAWFLLGESWFLRAHAGIAIGGSFRSFDLSVQAGWLQPSALVLMRFGFRL